MSEIKRSIDKSIETRIESQIDNYLNIYLSNDIDGMLTIQDRLSILSFELTKEYHSEYQEYVNYYGQYKVERAKSWLKLKHGSVDLTNAEIDRRIEADEDIQAPYTKRLFSESRLEVLKMQSQNLGKILNSISQRISYLKQEKERTK